MATTERSWSRAASSPIVVSAGLLVWPALWNGYPLVFADSGTYLAQAIEHYAGWDRPIFYSLFLLPLHWALSLWPVVIAQALLTTYVLALLLRTMCIGASHWWLLPLAGWMAAATSLPWLVSQIMPDLFTGLLIISIGMLLFMAERLTRSERATLILLATFMIAAHQSHILLTAGLLTALAPLLLWSGLRQSLVRALAPLLLACMGVVAINVLAFDRFALSPFGNVFLLARVIYDGPGRAALQRDCPQSGWRLCASRDALPETADEFLWRPDGPVALAGGAKAVSAEADRIIAAAVLAEPVNEFVAFLRNTAEQLRGFTTGDGLQAWPGTVTPVIARHFPQAEQAAYAASLQTSDRLYVPAWLQLVHAAAALAGAAGCCVLLVSRKSAAVSRLAGCVLLAVLLNAAITGGLSGPHDRYGSRVMWVPPIVALLGFAARR